MKINDKVAFITGGSGGLGSVIALRLAASGANIAISYGQNLVTAKEIEAQIIAMGRKCCILEMDQRDPLSIVLLHPISTSLPIITDPICGYLIFFFFPG